MATKSLPRGIVLTGIVLTTAGIGTYLWAQRGPSATQFDHLKAPRISHMDAQRMLVVEAAGEPSVVAGKAFKQLFAAYFKTKGVSRMQSPPAPRARWPLTTEKAGIEWKGRYSLPLPGEVTAAPAVQPTGGMPVRFETWEYGDVAEILHVGPYNEEEADIRRLQDFIAAHGYRVIGDHEEEYVRGPGMMFSGDPRKYLTIIRLRVTRVTSEPVLD